MPTELELELLRMAAEERQRGQTSDRGTELPDLDPDLFLPRSMRVAVSSPTPQPVPMEVTVELSGPDADWIREQLEQGAHPAVSMGSRVAAERPNANGDIFPAGMLASMFMTREARAQAELAGVADLIAEGTDVEFDPEGFEAPQTWRHRDASRHYSSGGGGRVVSQRGPDGRFHAVGIQPMDPERARTAPVSPRPTHPTPRSAGTVKLPPSPPRGPVDRSYLPTAIERIAGKDPFDD